MTDKPLARRLDDIEIKLDNFIDNQDKLLEVMDRFNETIETVSKIEETAKSIDVSILKAKVSEDWIHLVEYCIDNNFDTDEVMKIMRIFTGDFRKDRENENKK